MADTYDLIEKKRSKKSEGEFQTLVAGMIDGLMLGAGDAVVGINPASDSLPDLVRLNQVLAEVLARLRQRYRRVSVERVVSGPGIVDIYEALAGLEGKSIQQLDDRTLWQLGTSGEDSLAAAAVDRFCLSLGSVAGDIALAQGGSGVVIAGGLGLRIKDTLLQSGFASRFRAKGRFEGMMAAMPVAVAEAPRPPSSAAMRLRASTNMAGSKRPNCSCT